MSVRDISQPSRARNTFAEFRASFAALCALGVLGWALATASAQGTSTRNVTPEARPAASGRPWPVKFTDVAVEAGLREPVIAGGEKTKKYIIEANGTGVALVDLDGDGWLDIFLVNGSRLDSPPPGATNRIYRNLRNGKFADATAGAALGDPGWGNGVCAGDIDRDGLPDLYVTYWGSNRLYRNLGGLRFAEIARTAGVEGGSTGGRKRWSSGCTFLDYDRDGWLDLFVTRYQEFDPATAPLPGKSSTCEWKGMPVFCGPRGLPYGSAVLYRNKGDGTFEDVSERTGIAAAKGFYAFTAIGADLTGDGWPDLYIASDSTPSLLFRNERNGTFREIGTEAGVAFNEHGFEQGGMGVAVGDWNGDGKLDLVKTNFAGDHPNVYRGLGRGVFEDVVIPSGLGVNPQYVAWGIGSADLDNDGWADLLQVNGHVYPELESRSGAGEAYRNPRIVYRNLGGGRFEDVSPLSGPGIAARHSSRGAAFGDIDNDGDIDAVVMNMNEPPSLLRNDLSANHHWVRLRLRGQAPNRLAIGAVVAVEADGRTQIQPLLSQSSFVSQSDLRLHFGLGSAPSVTAIRVTWPSGRTQVFPGGPADREIVLEEEPAERAAP